MGVIDSTTGELTSVSCPSRFCMAMVALVDGKIGDHDGIMAMLSPQPCPWIGVRIVDDTADIVNDDSVLPTQVQQP